MTRWVRAFRIGPARFARSHGEAPVSGLPMALAKVLLLSILTSLLVPGGVVAQTPEELDPNYLATYSIIALDPETGELGIGVQSKAFAAGNRAQHIRGGVAAIAHQASANPMYGAMGVELLQRGYSPQEVVDMLVAADEGRDRRQVAIIDMEGRTAAWTGEGTSAWAGHRCGVNYCAQGNILSGPEVVDAIAASFEASSGRLEYRLMDALDAAEAAGGDARGKQSGGVFVYGPDGRFGEMVVDIRVDDHREPLLELRRILDLRRSGQFIAESNQRLTDGDLTGALERADAASALSPENDRAWVQLARVLVELDRRREALAALAQAVELEPRVGLQLPDNPAFEPLHDDPEFRRLTGS
ncbi:MAG: DUF1028 domain-containing protein [Gemmatimonadales bacterium]|nr:MAG: DUF1028 domain-containing protein [Gemmatimonadales bacterium]